MDRYADFLYHALAVDSLAGQLAQDQHPWANTLPGEVSALLEGLRHGDMKRWLTPLKELPKLQNITIQLAQAAIELKCTPPPDEAEIEQILHSLEELKPWRKGPYRVFGTEVDTEWRSNLKWERIAGRIDLRGKNVLDVGCANGYFGWRMLGAGARKVVGIDPSWLFVVQFLMINHYARQARLPGSIYLLPFRLEQLPADLEYFDTTFSMGVLYHRRSPFDHLLELKNSLKPGGEMVLETLVIPREYGEVLVPRDRYARMRNVWFLPSSEVLCAWLERVGFIDIELIDESLTTAREQRRTQWLKSQSLEDNLDPGDPSRTVEGYPAPRRAIILAHRPA